MGSFTKAIGILGGTFDPVHNGHVSIAESFAKSRFIDFLYVVLTPYPPHKEQYDITKFAHRLNMLRLAFEEYENIRVSEIEKELPSPSYTVRTLRYFRKELSGKEIYLCLGEDSVADFKKWHKWSEIIDMCNLLVARRPDTKVEEIEPDLVERIQYVAHEPVDISSTELRNLFTTGKGSSAEKLVPDKVADYIREHQLYREHNN